jgi:hypothetical protein
LRHALDVLAMAVPDWLRGTASGGVYRHCLAYSLLQQKPIKLKVSRYPKQKCKNKGLKAAALRNSLGGLSEARKNSVP